jgi:hypothetical protein
VRINDRLVSVRRCMVIYATKLEKCMRELTLKEIELVSGSTSILAIIAGSIMGGVIEGAALAIYGGIPGFCAGFVHGALYGAAGAIAVEGGLELAEITNGNPNEIQSKRNNRRYDY